MDGLGDYYFITQPIYRAQADRLSDQIMSHDGCFCMSSSYFQTFNVHLWQAGWFPDCTGPVLTYHIMEKYKARHSHVPTHITHCRQRSPPCSSLSHTQKWLLVSLLWVLPSLASLHTQQSKSPEMIWSDQRVRIIHSVGLFCIPDLQRDWIFHLHTRLLSNVTHTSLKQHCHSLLASSIFP